MGSIPAGGTNIESCMSGLSCYPGKVVPQQWGQGFESLTLCQINNATVAQLVELEPAHGEGPNCCREN